MDSTSYEARLAACGAVVDRLLAEHPGELRTVSVDVNVGRNYIKGGKVTLFPEDFAGVVRWASLLGAEVRNVYGRAGTVQADFEVEIDGTRVHVIGSSTCTFGGTEHDHETCLEQAQDQIDNPAPALAEAGSR